MCVCVCVGAGMGGVVVKRQVATFSTQSVASIYAWLILLNL